MAPFMYVFFNLISTLIFHFYHLHFKNKILSRIANIYDGYWHKFTKKLLKKKKTGIVGNISFVPLIAWQNITWLNFHKIQNFICIQTYDRPNFKKPERKRTYMSTEKKGGEGGSSNLVRVFRLHYFKQQIYSSFWRMVDVRESFLGHFLWASWMGDLKDNNIKTKCLELKRIRYSQNFYLIIRHTVT